MSRNKGSYNKPKTYPVLMSDLINIFKPEAYIDIDVKYLPIVKKGNPNIIINNTILPADIGEKLQNIDDLEEEKQRIEVRRINFE